VAPAGTWCPPAAGARIGPGRGVSPEEAVTWHWVAEILLSDVPRSGGGPAAVHAAPGQGAHDGYGRVSLRALTMPGYGERTLDSGARSSKAISRGRRRRGGPGHG